MKAHKVAIVLVLVLAAYWLRQRSCRGGRRRQTYTVPGVGRIQQATSADHDYWRNVYEHK